MFPIHLQDRDHGIGMGYSDFLEWFTPLCAQHVKDKRAKSFAFVFYDARNGPVRIGLKEAEGFRILNEASGDEITLFYLHDSALNAKSAGFNRTFLKLLGVNGQISPPCIVFFRVDRGNIEDVSVHAIDNLAKEPHMVVEELRRQIEANIARRKEEGDLSALSAIGDVIPLFRFLKALAG